MLFADQLDGGRLQAGVRHHDGRVEGSLGGFHAGDSTVFDENFLDSAVVDERATVLLEFAHHDIGEHGKTALVLSATALQHHLLHDEDHF